ncbi:MAG: hypothetical protein EPO61_12180 [Nitrospirae bacterium]|nr:MAG: hypothetical protein EPO61_12180 [Nitrospirota bacterium]
MNRFARMIVVGLALLGAGCVYVEGKETVYLESAKGQATQEEVRKKMGQPKYQASTLAGEPIWVYQVMWQDPSNQNSWGAPGTWCDEYVLTFDRQGVLRNWTHKSEGHGGELSPTYCVTDGFKPGS